MIRSDVKGERLPRQGILLVQQAGHAGQLQPLQELQRRAAAKAQALALADGMKPQTLVLAYALPVSISMTSPGFSPR